MSKNTIVVDLDGTLLNTNTFHQWLIFVFKKSLYLNIFDSIKILYIISLRILKINNHQQMKYKILKISESCRYKKYIKDFVNQLDMYINKDVLNYIMDKETISILATAAPLLYSQAISNKYNFDYCLATPSIISDTWYENIREKKKENLEILLNSLSINKADIVLSDHHDDIPIMHLAKQIILVNPSPKTKEILKINKINYFEISNIAS